MKIAIDTTPLKTPHAFRGTGTYTQNLIEALKKYVPENKYIFFTRGKKLSENADLVHYPYFDPFFLTLPLIKKRPTIVTIHDLIPLLFPDHFPRGVRGEIKWQIQKFSLKNVAAIITDSFISKKDIVRLTGFSQRKIYVIPLAPGEEFKKLGKGSWQARIKQKYRLPRDFVLYVGDVNWNKNVPGLIRAFGRLITSEVEGAPRFAWGDTSEVGSRLVLVGKAFLETQLKETQEINRLIDKLGIADLVLKLGFVPTKDLVAIYNLATVYIQPSFYEGFGLPCLEALSCGTPVVAANIPVLKEVLGETAIFVNPYNIEEIACGLKKVFEYDSREYQRRTEKGLGWVKKFSWKRVAEETVRVYREVIG